MPIVFGDLLPGETPLDDASGLLIPGITTRPQLNVVEAENIRLVLVKYFARQPTLEMAPFDFGWACDLHQEMFGDVWDWAGRFRTRDLNIGIPFSRIQESLYNLLADLHYWQSTGLDLISQAVQLHHRSVEIHPFVNGNGRWSRLLTNIWLAIHDHCMIAWPESVIGSVSPLRQDYIKALRAADNGNYELFQMLHVDHLMSEPDTPWKRKS